jgi:Ca-activated chloride channel family protein
MTFGAPIFLLALLLLPALVVGYVLMQRRPARYAVRYTNLDVLASVAGGSQAWRRHAGLAVFLLALAALLMGFARPKVTRLADREEATIVLVIDVSGSMSAKDVKPTRLEAAQVVVRDFLGDLPEKFQVGVVSFSEQAEVVTPATDDRDLATYAINYLYPQRGTAIGDGLARGVEVARAASPRGPTKNRPAAILLLSDGSQTEGMLLPLQGAARAKSFGIPIYTIALGTPEGVVEFHRFGTTRIIPVPPDPVTLKQIASQTGGRFYEAESAGDLREAYERLGSLVSKVERKQEVTYAFLGGGIVLLLAAAALGIVTFPRLP